MPEFYCVAESDTMMAEAVIKAALIARSYARVEAVGLRTPAEIAALGLERGEFTRLSQDALTPHLDAAAQGTSMTDIQTVAPTRKQSASRWLLPAAASIVALAVGVAGGYLFRDLSGGYVTAGAASVDALASNYEATLQGSLTGGASGQKFTYESPGLGQGTITLGRSFSTSSSRLCREFSREEIRASARTRGDGLACRATDGSWSVMFFREAS